MYIGVSQIICEINRVNSPIYIFFEVFRYDNMVPKKNLLCLLERVAKSMRLLFKQRLFSWFDSYDIYDEQGNTLYVVKGQLAWGHCLKIFDAYGQEVGTVKERLLTFLPKFEIYLGDTYLGCIKKEFSFFKPSYDIDYNGWHIEGSFMEWDYDITDTTGNTVASISKEILHWTDQYVIDVVDENDALIALMFVLAIDAEKCSRND